VIEEVMRIFGYNNVEAGKHISYTVPHEPATNAGEDAAKKTAALLEHLGFSEIIGLSLSNEKYYGDDPSLVKLVNPLSSELGVLRSDMLYNGLDSIAYNVNRKNTDLKFFEFGNTYAKAEGGKYRETKWLSLLVTGKIFRQNAYGLNREADFGFLKSVVGEMMNRMGLGEYKSTESEYKLFSYGLSFTVNKNVVADLGAVSSAALKKCGVDQPVFHARIDWERFVKATTTHKIQFEEIPKFPSVRRDLALLLDRSVNYGQVEDLAFATERKILKEVNLFDIYEDRKLGNKKSYAVSFTLLSEEATLTDKQIDATMAKLIDAYKTRLGAELR
jgi:phenylalanyl-tRNA synthetase beta chain